MDIECNHKSSKFIESILKFVFDEFYPHKSDEYYNHETSKCVERVFNYIFSKTVTADPIIKKSKDQKIADNQPTFYTKHKHPIRAAGILCYVKNPKNQKKIWLLRESKGYLTDTGGKTDKEDNCPMVTAIRETVEETNGHLFSIRHDENTCFQILSTQLQKQNNKRIYIKESKYLLFIFELKYCAFFKPLKRFGKIEKKDNEYHSYN